MITSFLVQNLPWTGNSYSAGHKINLYGMLMFTEACHWNYVEPVISSQPILIFSNLHLCPKWSLRLRFSNKMYIKITVFWVVAPCSLVGVYQRFRGPCCLHLMMEADFLLTTLKTSNPSKMQIVVVSRCCLTWKFPSHAYKKCLTLWSQSSPKQYLRIQFTPQIIHNTSPLQRSTG
jgi:hypothetical protein